MARMIDADELLDDITAEEEHGGMGAVIAGTLRRYVIRQPTLTPPNEPLTCGLVDRLGMPLRAGDTVAADGCGGAGAVSKMWWSGRSL